MRRSNKTLYEKIMRNVAQEVKHALNEWEVTTTDDYFNGYSTSIANNYSNKPHYIPNKSEVSKKRQKKIVVHDEDELSLLISNRISQNPTKPDLSDIDTSEITDMSFLFWDLHSIEELDLSSWDISNVETLKSMFEDCIYLKKVNLSGWDTSNVDDMAQMFLNCESLEEIDGISDFDMSNVTHIYEMFMNCKNLSELDLSYWNISNIENMDNIFKNCNKLNEYPEWY